MTTSALSPVDECCLKTALAFCILRQRRKRKAHETKLPFCRNLMSPMLLPVVHPSTTRTANRYHLDSMLRVGVAAAQTLYKGHDTMSRLFQDMEKSSTVDRLNGIVSHLATQLISDSHEKHDWISPWIQDSLVNYTPVAVCYLWYSLSDIEPNISDILIGAIGRTLHKIYLDEVTSVDNADLLVVNLVHLLERTVVLKLNVSNSCDILELVSISVGSELSLPVSMPDMANFVSKTNGTNLSAPSKLLLRLGVHDLMVKLSHS